MTRASPSRRPVEERASGAAAVSRRTRRRAPEIIAAAATVFAERGFHGATTQDIADVLGIRQASLYYYFPSKEAALELVCLKGVEGFLDAAAAIVAGPGNAPEKLAALIRSHLLPLIDRREFVKVFLNERRHLPVVSRRRIGRWSRRLERLIQGVVQSGIDTGEFRADLDPRLTTLAVLGMCNAVSTWQRKEDVEVERIADQFAALVISGAIAPASAGRRGRS